MFKKIYSLKQKFIECKNRIGMTSNVIPIYMFHCVTDKISEEYKNISVTQEEFEKFIARKLSEGKKIISIREIDKVEKFDGHGMIITFDDVFESVYLYGIPILRKYRVPYTVFISPQLIDKPGYITREQYNFLKEDEFCTIGAHSLSHKVLRKLTLEKKIEELNRKSHEILMEHITEYFAFPYGSCYACDKESRNIVKKEYKYGFSTLDFAVSYDYLKRKPEFLPRINVNSKNCAKV